MSEKLKINFTSGSIKKELDNEQQNSSERQQQHSCFYSSQTAVPSTILITNNYSSPQDDGSSSINLNNDRILDLNNKQSSITILTRNSSETDNTSNKMPTSTGGSTVVLDRINICINNHPIYCSRTQNSIQKSSLDSEASINIKENNFVPKTMTATSDTTVMPTPAGTTTASTTTTTTQNTTGINNNNSPSLSLRESPTSSSSSTATTTIVKSETTISNEFSIGQDVLVQKKDGRFYLGTIIAISKCQALVKFDDNTDCWSTFEELTKLDVGGQNDEPMCVVCKKQNKNDVVEVCERCGRGYHRKCADGSFQKKGIWFCRRCTAPNGFKTKNIDYQTTNYIGTPKKISYKILHKSQLPYNLDSLSWDSHHRVNLEQIYCYCGKNGEWYNKMLQCCKCQQWFHEKCVNCLLYPVFAGDRFYVFACTMCNNGKEFLRRLELKWNDVVHLVLFNVTLYNQRKYYHANKSIVPYAIENWPMLQLQPSMRNLSATGIRDNILKTLSINNTRFKCGKEIKKGHSFWGLRSRIPPPSPKVIISQDIELTDQYLKEHKKLNIIPIVPPKKNSIQYISGNFDNESSSVTSDDESFYRNDVLAKTSNTKITNEENTTNKKLLSNSVNSTITTKENGGKIYCRRLSNLIDKKTNKIHLNGFDSNDLSDKSHDCIDYDENSKEQDNDDDDFINNSKREHNQNDKNNICNSFEISHTVSASSNVTKHKRKRKLSSSGIHSLSNKKLKIENNTQIKISSSSSTMAKLLATKITNADIKNSQDIIEISDSSDETSSRGTLDLIIPPPKNFQGRNNPFRLTTPKKNENNPKNSGKASFNNNTAAGQFRIVRTVKRKLSAKDIMIGPNKEVKRRRVRRLSGNVEVISTATSLQSLPKSAAFLPIRTDSKDLHLSTIRSTLNSSGSNVTQFINSSIPPPPPINIGSISNILNGRRLRQRRGKNYSENNSTRRNSCSGSNSNGNSSSSSGSNTCTNNNGNISINNNQINILNTLNNTLTNSSSNQSPEVSLSDLKTSVHMYFGGINRILDGENFIVRAKRFTPDGKIQYLIEWEGVS